MGGWWVGLHGSCRRKLQPLDDQNLSTALPCCSACRAVWYCGTACSHADWRAGHKHVCKALGEARLAAKEARRAARSDPAAAAEEQARDAAAAAEEEEEQE